MSLAVIISVIFILCSPTDKLFSLLPEYVVPYTIHLLAHDPDYVKVQDIEQLKEIKEALWFVLEIIMAKNENNSHAFIRKMVENIKQTKDAQSPTDPKTNEKLYTVCDVAMNIIMSKSTTYSLESPKDPVLPSSYFTKPDKNFSNTKNYLPPEMKAFFTPGKPKSANVLGAVNKPLSSAGKPLQSKASRMETASNDDSSSNPGSPQRSKTRHDSTEMDHSENEDISLKRADSTDKDIEKPRGRKRGVASNDDQESKPKRGRKKAAANTTAAADSEDQWDEDNRPEDEQNSPPKKGRRGRPPKSATPSQDTPAKGKRGRKKAVPPPEDEEEEEEEERVDEEAEEDEEEDDRSSENMELKTKGGRQARAPRRSQGSESAESTPQKRRGRPPKSAQPPAKKPVRGGRSKAAAAKEDEEEEDEDEEEEQEDEPTPKGRKKAAGRRR